MIEIEDLAKCYGAVQVLKGISLSIPSGITGLLGPNGSGKSTLIKALLGLVQAGSGHGAILCRRWPNEVRSIRESIGYLPEDDCYIAGLSGIESVALMANLAGLPKVEGLRRAHEICDFCEFGEERYRGVEGYSTGMRQKLKFAQALVHDPPLLILDEPTTGLDPGQRESMLRRIKTLNVRYGKSILLSTHILPDVKTICDSVVIMVNGEVKVTDTLERLSRPAHPTVHVSVVGDATKLVSRLQESGFNVVTDADGSLRISPVAEDRVDVIWKLAVASETKIRRLVPAMNSLDKIFIETASAAEAI